MIRFAFFLLLGCSSRPVILSVSEECEREKQIAYARGYDDASLDREGILSCINMQLDKYGDLCAEHEGSDPEFQEADSYFFGVKCATEAARACAEMGPWYGY